MACRASVLLADGRAVGDDLFASFLPWLGGAETARYQRFARRERQRQFVIGRVLARMAFGQLLGVPARDLALEERSGLGPVLFGPHAAPGLSISHSGHWIACAVSADTALGLDIEAIDPARNTQALAQQAFDAEQNAWLAARPEHSRLRDFYMMWSAHEARIKLGQQPVQTIELFHPDISVVLCSAQPLGDLPKLKLVSLPL
jgi:4'-phosphopantetheinyl transferase